MNSRLVPPGVSCERLEDRQLLAAGALAAPAGGWWVDWTPSDGASASEVGLELTTVTPQTLRGKVHVAGAWAQNVQLGGMDFTHLTLPDYGFSDQAGLPQLPVIRKTLVAPVGAIVSVTFAGQSQTFSLGSLGLKYDLQPAQPGASKSDDTPPPLAIDAARYGADTFGSDAVVRVTEAGTYAGQRLVMLEIAPVAYNALREVVSIYSDLEFTVTFEGGKAAQASLTADQDQSLSEMASNYVAGSYAPASGAAESSGRLLIITDSLFSGTVPLSQFVANKKALGYAVDVADTTVAGSSATAIRAYIQGRYNTLATRPDAVLLVGDTGAIPAFVGVGTDNPATDLYYACMDSGDDWLPEFPIGRFSAATVSQLQAMVDKTIAYEAAPSGSWMSRAAFMASLDNSSVSEGTHNWVISTYMDPQGYTSQKLYSSTYSATTAQVTAAFNAGVAFGVYSGHGSTTTWADGPVFTQSNINSLTNSGMYPFVASFACVTGSYTLSECFAETWQRAANKGAVEVLASSVNSYWDQDDTLERKLFAAFFGSTGGDFRFGEVVLRAKQLYFDYYGAADSETRRYLEMYNLFGDPTLTLAGQEFHIATAAALPPARVDQPYTATLVASSGTSPYTWQWVSGTLPDGLTWDAQAATIAGTPTAAGEYDFTVSASDAAGASDSRAFHLSVISPLLITSPASLGDAAIGVPYRFDLQAAGGTAPYTWTLTSAGYQQSSVASACISGGTAKHWNADDSSWVATLPFGFTFFGHTYTQVHVCSNGFLDFASTNHDFSNSTAALISNIRISPLWDDLLTTPASTYDIYVDSQAGRFVVRWNAQTYRGSAPARFEVVLTPDGGIQFNYQATGGGNLAPTVGISAGDGVHYLLSTLDGNSNIPAGTSIRFDYRALPSGLTLSSGGVLSGTPTQLGTYPFTLQVADSASSPQTQSRTFSLTVGLPVMSLVLPSSLTEGAGAGVGTVYVPLAPTTDLVVTLTSSNPAKLTVDASVTILAGSTSAPFNYLVPDNNLFDGRRGVTVTAHADSQADATARIDILDNDVYGFAFSPVADPQIVDTAAPVTVRAVDINGETLSGYSGPATLTAAGDGGAVPMTLVAGSGTMGVSDPAVPYQASGSAGTVVGYRTYPQIEAELTALATAYPGLAQLVSIGSTVNGLPILAIKISDNVAMEEADEPAVKYVGTIHGNEKLAEEMCMDFVEYLLTDYGTVPSVTDLVNREEIWIVPVMNPDGFVANVRENAQGADLNRSFPEGSGTAIGNVLYGPAMDLTGLPPEVQAMMRWSAAHDFTLSANFHSGSLVVNYPYDNAGLGSVYSPSPDQTLFAQISTAYASHNLPMYNSSEFPGGITNGAAWYEVVGGMQDWNYRYLGDNEVTIELSNTYAPSADQLPTYWNDNRDAMMAYLQTALTGVQGVVTGVEGAAVAAAVQVVGIDHLVFTDRAAGDYHRMLLPGTYDLTFTAPGYLPQTVHNVVVSAGSLAAVNVVLSPNTQITLSNGQWQGTAIIHATDTHVVLTAANAGGVQGHSNAFDVVDPLAITTGASLPTAAAGTPYSVQLSAVGGQSAYTWSVVGAGNLSESIVSGTGWDSGGTSINLQADDDAAAVSLPFSFPFYGETFSTAYVSTNGLISFTDADNEYDNSAAALAERVAIAACWDDLDTRPTGCGVFVESTPDQVLIRWEAVTLDLGTPVQFEAVLHADGRIDLNYLTSGDLSPTVGVSSGDGTNYALSDLDGSEGFSGQSRTWVRLGLPMGLSLDPTTGRISGTVADAGDYEFTVQVHDAAPATATANRDFHLSAVVDTTPPDVAIEVNGGRAQRSMISEIAAVFSEDVGGTIERDSLALTDADGAPVDITLATFSYDAVSHRGVWDLSQVTFVNGRYSGQIVAADWAGNPGSATIAFGVLRGDENGDGIVDQGDSTIWYDAYGGSAGDITGDGMTDQADYTVWYNAYGSVLPAAESTPAAAIKLTGSTAKSSAFLATESQAATSSQLLILASASTSAVSPGAIVAEFAVSNPKVLPASQGQVDLLALAPPPLTAAPSTMDLLDILSSDALDILKK